MTNKYCAENLSFLHQLEIASLFIVEIVSQVSLGLGPGRSFRPLSSLQIIHPLLPDFDQNFQNSAYGHPDCKSLNILHKF